MQGPQAYGSIDLDDLCYYPGIQTNFKFKQLDFDKYDGSGYPYAHLQMWRSEAAKVIPPFIDNEIYSLFIKSTIGTFHAWLGPYVGYTFAQLVVAGEQIEEGLKASIIMNFQTIQRQLEQVKMGSSRSTWKRFSPKGKKEDEEALNHSFTSHAKPIYNMANVPYNRQPQLQHTSIFKSTIYLQRRPNFNAHALVRQQFPSTNRSRQFTKPPIPYSENPLPPHGAPTMTMIALDEVDRPVLENDDSWTPTISQNFQQPYVLKTSLSESLMGKTSSVANSHFPYSLKVMPQRPVILNSTTNDVSNMTRSGQCYVNPEVEELRKAALKSKDIRIEEMLEESPKKLVSENEVVEFLNIMRKMVCAFDGTKRNVVRKIELPMEIGPVTFDVDFFVMDISLAFNMLLGRPWIHVTGVVPSTLHQKVKYIVNGVLVTVNGEEEHIIQKATTIRYLGIDPETYESSYHSIECHSIECVAASYIHPKFKGKRAEMAKPAMVATKIMLSYLEGTIFTNRLLEIGECSKQAKFEEVVVEDITDEVCSDDEEDSFGFNNLFGPANMTDPKERWRRMLIERAFMEKHPNFHLVHHAKAPMGSHELVLLETVKEESLCDSGGNLTINALDEEELEFDKGISLVNESSQANWIVELLPAAFISEPANDESLNNDTISDFIYEIDDQTYSEEDNENFDPSHELTQMLREEKPKLQSNQETKTINLGTEDDRKEIKINAHLSIEERKELIEILDEFQDVFVWSYRDMPGLDLDIAVHAIPLYSEAKLVKQKLRRMKPEVLLKDGRVRVCVDYKDLNKAKPKDDFPLPHIQILLDNAAKNARFSFVDGYSRYNQIKMKEEDKLKTTFITQWGTFCYKVMPFGLKNARATYQRSVITLLHDFMHTIVELYVDDMVIMSKEEVLHTENIKKVFEHLRKYQLRLNPAKCTFDVDFGKLLGFIVSHRGREIEVDPAKIKAIDEMPPPKTLKEVRRFLGRINYIACFIANLTTICEPIFKLLRKDNPHTWNNQCQQASDKIKEYLKNPPILVPPIDKRPFILFIIVLVQHDDSGKKERAIYYVSKKFNDCESKYSPLEKTCCALAWTSKKLRHYMLTNTTYLLSRMDPIKFIFEKPTLFGRISQWYMLLSEFDIVYTTQKAIKGQAIANHLAEHATEDYEPIDWDFPNEDILAVEAKSDSNNWKLFFDGAINQLDCGLGAVFVSLKGDHFPIATKLDFACTNNKAEYEACIAGIHVALDMNVRDLGIYDALATLASMIQISSDDVIKPLMIEISQEPTHCMEIKVDDKPWFHDIKQFLQNGEYPLYAFGVNKKTINKLVASYFLSKNTLYKHSANMTLLRCVDETEAKQVMTEPFSMWGIDVIGTINPKASNSHQLILVAIDYFTKWVEATSYASVTKKVVTRFIKREIIYRYGQPKAIIINNASNLSNDMMTALCKQFKIKHLNSFPYRPKMNGVVEVANKNIKKILAKMIVTYKDWHEMLPYALHAYSVRTSTRATPYSLVYGMEAILPLELEIPSMRILSESGI
ncbi:hypothetical protein SLEP1_g6831 [Rubroshorea leprosula]|uniref:Integrase catalytic domain-containing protein n=1 Tax=Rubroshorea leprosula TaxID=152421 RepID=A0AAV5I5G9_9ROSI|nr:hypothetical protein SLEP1_g6831 [Rubroshorea leprosula]